jgi:hypothetical protein
MTPIIKAKNSYFNIHEARGEKEREFFVLKEKERRTGKINQRL